MIYVVALGQRGQRHSEMYFTGQVKNSVVMWSPKLTEAWRTDDKDLARQVALKPVDGLVMEIGPPYSDGEEASFMAQKDMLYSREEAEACLVPLLAEIRGMKKDERGMKKDGQAVEPPVEPVWGPQWQGSVGRLPSVSILEAVIADQDERIENHLKEMAMLYKVVDALVDRCVKDVSPMRVHNKDTESMHNAIKLAYFEACIE